MAPKCEIVSQRKLVDSLPELAPGRENCVRDVLVRNTHRAQSWLCIIQACISAYGLVSHRYILLLVRRRPTVIFPASTELASEPPTLLRGWPGRSAAASVWWEPSRMELCSHAGLCPAAPCGRYPVGQQEVHEYEAPGGCHWGRLHCRLTSFMPEFANQFAHLDTTQADVKIKMDGFAFLDI